MTLADAESKVRLALHRIQGVQGVNATADAGNIQTAIAELGNAITDLAGEIAQLRGEIDALKRG